MKLQKLLYYSQVWTLVWTQEPLIAEDFQAWANGPVLRGIYDLHKGCFQVQPGFFGGNPNALSADQVDIIQKVLGYYGDKDPQWLSTLTHMEKPWQSARTGYANGERCESTISKSSIMEYYSGL
jgi:uncharacterized phage-associated protein